MADEGRGGTERGERRRALLLTSAADLLLEHGPGRVSHRAVAARAGLPLAATTYYFASLDELLDQALGHLADRWLEQARCTVAGLPARLPTIAALVGAVLDVVTAASITAAPDRADDLVTFYERYLQAGRHPRLRPLVQDYDRQLDRLLADVLARGGLPRDAAAVRLVLATVDGAVLRALAEGDDPMRSARATVTRLVRLLRAQSRERRR